MSFNWSWKRCHRRLILHRRRETGRSRFRRRRRPRRNDLRRLCRERVGEQIRCCSGRNIFGRVVWRFIGICLYGSLCSRRIKVGEFRDFVPGWSRRRHSDHGRNPAHRRSLRRRSDHCVSSIVGISSNHKRSSMRCSRRSRKNPCLWGDNIKQSGRRHPRSDARVWGFGHETHARRQTTTSCHSCSRRRDGQRQIR